MLFRFFTMPCRLGSRDPTCRRQLVRDFKYMTTGTVKFFNQQKGYGFITPEDGSKDVFVHITAVEQSGMSGLAEGQKVSFEVQNEARGPKAVDLQEA